MQKNVLRPHTSTFSLELVEHANDSFCLTWWKEPTSRVDYAMFYFLWNILSMSMILFA
jgi:hypothetical protein